MSKDPERPWTVDRYPWGGRSLQVLAGFNSPYGIELGADGSLYVADLREGRVLRFDRLLRYTGWLGALAGATPEVSGWHVRGRPLRGNGPGEFEMAHSIGFDSAGRIYVADYRNGRVHVYEPDGRFAGTLFDPPARPELAFRGPASTDFDARFNLWVADYDGHRVYKFAPDGAFVGWLGASADGRAGGFAREGVAVASNAPGGLARPHMVQVDAEGFIYVVETGNHRVQKFRPDGSPMGWIGGKADGSLTRGWENASTPAMTDAPGGFHDPASLRLVDNRYFLVADNANHRIEKFSLDGRFLGWLGGTAGGGSTQGWSLSGKAKEGKAPGMFSYPFDARQHEGKLYVADGHNGRVQIFELDDQAPDNRR